MWPWHVCAQIEMMNFGSLFVTFGNWLNNLLDCGFTRYYIPVFIGILLALVSNNNTSQSDKTSIESNNACCDGKDLDESAEKKTEEVASHDDHYQILPTRIEDQTTSLEGQIKRLKEEDTNEERDAELLKEQIAEKEKKIEDMERENLLLRQQSDDKDKKINDMEQEMETLRINLEEMKSQEKKSQEKKSQEKENDTGRSAETEDSSTAGGSKDPHSEKKPTKSKIDFQWLKDHLPKLDKGNPSVKMPKKMKKGFKKLKGRIAKLAQGSAGAPSEKPRKMMKGFKKFKNGIGKLVGKQKEADACVKIDCFQLLRDGKAELAKGNAAEAIKLLSQAIEMGQFNFMPLADALFQRGMAKFLLKQWEEAVVDCTESIKQLRLHTRCFLVRGCCRIMLGKYDEAFEDFDEYIASSLHHPKAFYDLAIEIEEEAKTIKKIEEAMVTLCVYDSATMEQIKKSYKTLCLKYHPDKNRWDDTETRLKKQEICKSIITAYKFLTSEGDFENSLEKLQKLKEMKLDLVKMVEKLLYEA